MKGIMFINKITATFYNLGRALWTVMKIGFKKPVTLEYPEKKRPVSPDFRGKLALKRNEQGELTCTGCELCIRCCPCKGVISIKKEKTEDGKFKVTEYNIDTGQCIFCGNCAYVCASGSVYMTDQYELATTDKSSLISKEPKEKSD